MTAHTFEFVCDDLVGMVLSVIVSNGQCNWVQKRPVTGTSSLTTAQSGWGGTSRPGLEGTVATTRFLWESWLPKGMAWSLRPRLFAEACGLGARQASHIRPLERGGVFSRDKLS
jgi:hypothetical protein